MSAPENANNTLDVPVSNPPSNSVVAPAAVAEVAVASVVSPVSDVAPVVAPEVVESVVTLKSVVISENNSNKLLGIDLTNNKYSDLLTNEDVKSAVTLLLHHANSVENIVNTFKSLYPIDVQDIPIIIHVLNKAYTGLDKEKKLVDKLSHTLLLNTVQALLIILIKENKIVVDNPDTVVDDIKKVISMLSLVDLVVKSKCCGLCV
jgi:hypothetical protein